VILGLGVDFLETSRVERELSWGEWLLEDGIFTAGEISYCRASNRPARRYAAYFAAKEAILKALGVQVSDLAMFREIEIGPGISPGYKVTLSDRLKAKSEQLGVRRIELSIAHKANQTGAFVILEN
jgi:holo-[acyl-carrier protein] synthase